MTGQLITASYEQLRLEMGTSGFITDTPFKTLEATITETWLTDLWAFADKFQIQLQDDGEQFRLQRKNDKFLMDAFIQAGCDRNILKELNECRMFLHAVTLSDIVSADGYKITINAWNGIREDRGGSKYQWPRTQQILPTKHWEQWRRILEQIFLSRGTPRGLTEHLLEWTDGAPSHWKWYFCPAEDRLYAQEGWLWRAYCQHRGRTSSRQCRSKYIPTTQTFWTPPEGLRHASVSKQRPLSLIHI